MLNWDDRKKLQNFSGNLVILLFSVDSADTELCFQTWRSYLSQLESLNTPFYYSEQNNVVIIGVASSRCFRGRSSFGMVCAACSTEIMGHK